jgi:dCMP deaminase
MEVYIMLFPKTPKSQFINDLDTESLKDPYRWPVSFMKAALEFSAHSKCAAKKVACILVDEDTKNIVSIGVNGTLPGLPNCSDLFRKEGGSWEKRNKIGEWIPCDDALEHFFWSKKNEVHAEINALAKASRRGIPTEGLSAFVTYSPCNSCSLSLAASGIKRVYYIDEYDAESEGKDLLRGYDIHVVDLYSEMKRYEKVMGETE